MSKKREIIIWMPLSPNASWGGEGISRTIENIMVNLPSHIICRLVVSKAHAIELTELTQKHTNIKIKSFGFSSKKYTIKKSENIPARNIFNFIITKSKTLTWLKNKLNRLTLEQVSYGLGLYLYCILQRLNLFLPGRKVIWFPVPHIPGINLLKGKKIYSFWDPFIFEYKEFSNINQILFKKFNAIYSKADAIVTQSQANKNFLTHIFQIKADKIKVINNGSPNYSEFLPELTTIGNRHKDGLLATWEKPKYIGKTYKDAFNKKIADLINKSVLWRLLCKLTSNKDKVLIISTQVRPYKGFDLLLKLLNELVCQETTFRYQFIFTATLPEKTKELYPLLYERIHEIIRVSNKQHALLYYIADLVIHPSYVEGGLGVYPQFEAASLGTPTLANIGRHTKELSPDDKLTLYHTTDFTHINASIARIHELILSEESRNSNLAETHKLAIPWQQSAEEYNELFQKTYYDQ